MELSLAAISLKGKPEALFSDLSEDKTAKGLGSLTWVFKSSGVG